MGEKSTNFNTIKRLIFFDRLLQQRRGYTNKQIAEIYRQEFDCGSERTVLNDIARLKSEFLDSNDQIEKFHRSFHRYKEAGFSVFGNPITNSDAETLMEIQLLLNQLKHFGASQKLNNILRKLKNRFYNVEAENNESVILEQNLNLAGSEFLTVIFDAINNKTTLDIQYQDFNSLNSYQINVSPIQLRQNNSRWLLIGVNNSNYDRCYLSVDRVKTYFPAFTDFKKTTDSPTVINKYFEEMIGVSIPETDDPVQIKLLFTDLQAQYVFTKPIHKSLTKIRKVENGIEAFVIVKPNYELYQWLLGMGSGVKVLSPENVKHKLMNHLQFTLKAYE